MSPASKLLMSQYELVLLERAEKAEREVLSLKDDVDEQRGMSEHHHSLACDYAEERNEERERAEKAELLVKELAGALGGLLARDLMGCSCDEPERGECKRHGLADHARAVLAKVGK